MHKIFILILLGLIFSATGVLAGEVQLLCLEKNQIVKFSSCNPAIPDRTCFSNTACNYCVTYNADTGVYCPSSINVCNTLEELSCSSLVIEHPDNNESPNNNENNGSEPADDQNIVRKVKADVAYILKNERGIDKFLLKELEEDGFSYEIIYEKDVLRTDFLDYYIILVGDQKLDKPEDIPVYKHRSIIVNSDNYFKRIDNPQLGWSDRAGIVSSPTVVNVNALLHPIASNLNKIFFAYTTSNVNVNTAILEGKKPSEITIIASIGTILDAAVAAVLPGVKYLNGKVAEKKGVFFGITDAQYWTDETSLIFKNALNWLVDEPDLDGDGFDSNDCNDRNPEINPEGESPFFDCKNDAPILLPFDDLEFFVTDRVVIAVDAVDPENRKLIYKINDPRFEFAEDLKIFTWQPGEGDEGNYEFRVEVSDGKFKSSGRVKVKIKNNPPTFEIIKNLIWDEDTSAEINLKNYFSDLNGDELTFGIQTSSGDDNIIVDSADNGVFKFSSKKNWFGEDWVLFWAFDGVTKTVSNRVELLVKPVNDPPIAKQINDLTLGEDEEFTLNLDDYFLDVDSELVYEAHNNRNVNVKFEGNKAIFSGDKDWSGIEKITINAKDEDFSVESNRFAIIIEERGEPPEFLEFNCDREIKEDEKHSCELKASDFEGNEFEFSTGKLFNLECDIEGNVLSYVSTEDYNGEAGCELIVSDAEHGSTKKMFNVNVIAVNDAPRIMNTYPKETFLVIPAGQEKEFLAEIFDIEGDDFDVNWYLDNTKKNQGNRYIFDEESGTHLLQVVADDHKSKSEKIWNIIVGHTEDFNCNEVGGDICLEKQICNGNLLNVKDSANCCSVECSAAPPSFKDGDACEKLSNLAAVDLKLVDDSDIELGDNIKADIEVENNYKDNQNFNVNVHLYDIERDQSVNEIKEKIDLRDGDKGTIRVDLNVPLDLNLDRKYVIFASAEDNVCNQDYKEISIKRPEDKIAITKFDVINEAVCGDLIKAAVRVENLGERDRQISLSLKNSDLNVDMEAETFTLEKYGEHDSKTEEFEFVIPNNIKEGDYELDASLNDGEIATETRKVHIENCKGEITSEKVEIPEPIKLESGESIQRKDFSNGIVLAIMLLTSFAALAFFFFYYISYVRK